MLVADPVLLDDLRGLASILAGLYIPLVGLSDFVPMDDVLGFAPW